MSSHAPQDSKKTRGKKPPKKITETYLHNAGLYYLQRFSASSESFRRVMMRKVERSCRAHPEQDRAECARMVDELVRKFLGAGLLNDGQYAEAMVSTLRRRGLSSRAIQARLAARGVEAAHVRAALLGVEGEDDDLQAAVRLARRKRLGPFGAKDPDGEKDMAAFARAGFGYALARRVLAMSADEAEKILKTF